MTVDPCLALYGIVAAVVAPYVLARHSATEDAPRLGVAAWLIAAMSVLGSWLAAGASLAAHPGIAARAIGVVILVGLSIRLTWAWIVTWRDNRSRRARHTQAAVLLGRRDPITGALVVDSPEPLAYCLPHAGGGMIVITTGARAALSPREFDAVLAHERAHLDGRHHLLISVGQILARALPVPALFGEIGKRVPQLLEMRADDAAARRHGRDAVSSAIARMSQRITPESSLGAGGPAATVRALRLAGDASRHRRGRLTLLLTAVTLAVGPYLATLPACPHPW